MSNKVFELAGSDYIANIFEGKISSIGQSGSKYLPTAELKGGKTIEKRL